MKILFPIINVLIAGALFFFYTNQVLINAPLVENPDQVEKSDGGIKALSARKADLDRAIVVAKQLSAKIADLNDTYNSFTPDELARLDTLLPDNVDNIQLIIDTNDIAKRNGMSIRNIKINTDQDTAQVAGASSVAPANVPKSGDPFLGNVYLSFTTTGTYDSFKNFMQDLSRSLRIVDITSSSFNTADTGVYDYNVELKTYWLK